LKRVKTGVIGCGFISEIYIKNLTSLFDNVEVVAVSDINIGDAKKRAKQFGISKACLPEDLYADAEVELIVNLTIPKAHAEVSLAAIRAGKHVYVEKTLAITLEEADAVLQAAKERGLLVGCAPDTFLGAGIQTCKEIIELGEIGLPTLVSGVMASGGPETWHPNPEFLYKTGAGPLFDMGPYYITTMLELFGNVTGVTAMAKKTFEERMITSEPLNGRMIQVEVPTNVAAVLSFGDGPVGNLIMSFDANGYMQRMEVFGTKGTIIVPDPNYFAGPVLLKKNGCEDWKEVPLVNRLSDNSRGMGIADMAKAIQTGSPFSATGARGRHVLEVMYAIYSSPEEMTHKTLH